MLYPYSAKLGVWNSLSAHRIVAVEPWAGDYTLMPGEKLEVVAFGKSAVPWFIVVEWDNTTQVYCENADDYRVMQDNRQLDCGHQRQL
jgi:hypothetical protein